MAAARGERRRMHFHVQLSGKVPIRYQIWACLISNEKPGGQGVRLVPIGTIEIAI